MLEQVQEHQGALKEREQQLEVSEKKQIEHFQAGVSDLTATVLAQGERAVKDVEAEVLMGQKERASKIYEYGLLMGDIEKASAKIGDRGSTSVNPSELGKHVAMMQYVMTKMKDDKRVTFHVLSM